MNIIIGPHPDDHDAYMICLDSTHKFKLTPDEFEELLRTIERVYRTDAVMHMSTIDCLQIQ